MQDDLPDGDLGARAGDLQGSTRISTEGMMWMTRRRTPASKPGEGPCRSAGMASGIALLIEGICKAGSCSPPSESEGILGGVAVQVLDRCLTERRRRHADPPARQRRERKTRNCEPVPGRTASEP